MIVWLPSLPKRPLAQGFQYTPDNNSVEFPVDVGDAEVRQRATAAGADLVCPFKLRTSQVGDLKHFHKITLRDGALAYLWTDPVIGDAAMFRLRSFTLRAVRSNRWIALCQIRRKT